MSVTVLQFAFRIAGALTNATSVVLSDPTGAYGVKRTDTSAVLVADSTAMTTSQTGVYQYALTVGPGVPLSWWAEAVYNGVTYRFEREEVTALGDGVQPSSYYLTLADLYAVEGVTNINAYSNLEADNRDLDPVRTQRAMDDTKAWINVYLRDNGCEWPAPTTDPAFALLTQAAAYLTAAWLYRSRGAMDMPAEGQPNPFYVKSGTWTKEASRLLGTYVMGKKRNISTSVAFTGGRDRAGYFPCG